MINSFRQIGVITNLTFREARRRRLVWIALGLGGAFVLLFALGYYSICQEVYARTDSPVMAIRIITQASAMYLSAGLYVINFLVVMLTVLTAVGIISSEIASGTIHTIAAKPIRRIEILIGKWIGLAVMLIVYIVLMAGALILSLLLISGYQTNNPIPALGVMILEGLAVLSATILGSTLLSTLANGVTIFMLYGVAFVGGWVEQIGAILQSQTAKDLGIASSLLMPSEALWRYAASLLNPRDAGPSFTPFTNVSTPTPAFLIYAVVYIVGLLIASMIAFSRRDF